MLGTETLLAAGLVMAAAGTGMTMYSSHEAAKNERAMANYNAQIARQQAEMQGAVARRQGEIAQYNAQLQMRQAEMAKQSAQMQARIQEYNADMQNRNATTMRAYADNAEAQGREQARRMREEKMRILGQQRSQFAKGGVMMEGSPLAVLAETDGLLELNIQDSWYQTVQESKKLRSQADDLDSDAEMMRWNAEVGRRTGDFSSLLSMGAAQASYDNALFETAAAGAGVRIAKRQAEIDKLAGYNRASAYDMQTAAAGISWAADMSSTLLTYNYNKKPKATTTSGTTAIG